MVITLFAPAQKVGRASKTPGSVLKRHNLYKWLSFRSAATAVEQKCNLPSLAQSLQFGGIICNLGEGYAGSVG
jgi:hypothetical protein